MLNKDYTAKLPGMEEVKATNLKYIRDRNTNRHRAGLSAVLKGNEKAGVTENQ